MANFGLMILLAYSIYVLEPLFIFLISAPHDFRACCGAAIQGPDKRYDCLAIYARRFTFAAAAPYVHAISSDSHDYHDAHSSHFTE